MENLKELKREELGNVNGGNMWWYYWFLSSKANAEDPCYCDAAWNNGVSR